MKKVIPILSVIAFLIVLSSCWLMEKTITGEGEVISYEMELEDATSLEVNNIKLIDHGDTIYSHLFTYEAKNTGEHIVKLEGQKEIIESINVKSKSGKLTISGNRYETYETPLFSIKIYGYDFSNIDISDVRGSFGNKMSGDDFSIKMSGASSIKALGFDTKTFNATLTDGAHLDVDKLSADDSNIYLTKASSMIVNNFISEKCTVTTENSASITSNFDCESLKMDLSGNSSGSIKGTAFNAKLEVSGSSKLIGIDLTANKTDANILGASFLSITVDLELKAYINGDSTLNYGGECKTKIDASGEAIVKHIEGDIK